MVQWWGMNLSIYRSCVEHLTHAIFAFYFLVFFFLLIFVHTSGRSKTGRVMCVCACGCGLCVRRLRAERGRRGQPMCRIVFGEPVRSKLRSRPVLTREWNAGQEAGPCAGRDLVVGEVHGATQSDLKRPKTRACLWRARATTCFLWQPGRLQSWRIVQRAIDWPSLACWPNHR